MMLRLFRKAFTAPSSATRTPVGELWGSKVERAPGAQELELLAGQVAQKCPVPADKSLLSFNVPTRALRAVAAIPLWCELVRSRKAGRKGEEKRKEREARLKRKRKEKLLRAMLRAGALCLL